MQLAENGLPQRGQVGYEIFDQQSALGTTSFVQNINNVRALEGELARTISSLARIKSARVHLVLPERELFRRERQDPTASIVLSVRGELAAGEIRAIQHLVASAIEGLTPSRVSIIDDAGQLLASGSGNDENSVIAGEAEERTLGVETRLRTRIEDLLANVVGAGKARVQVSVDLDLERSTKTAETFDPDGQVVRSTQTRELANSSSDGAAAEGVTVANELPGGSEPERRRRQRLASRPRPPRKPPTTRSPRPPRRRSAKPAASSASRSRSWSTASTSTTAPARRPTSRAHARGTRADPRPRPVGRRLQTPIAATRSRSSTCSLPSGRSS